MRSTQSRHCAHDFPDIRLVVVGSGWWQDALHQYVAERGLAHLVTFEGHVDEQRKHEILAASWVLALPSLKEGWGLVVGEAAQHQVPTLAYRSAGGTTESVTDGVTGLLAADRDDFETLLRRLIADDDLPDDARRGRLEAGHELHLGPRDAVVRSDYRGRDQRQGAPRRGRPGVGQRR